jgi:hypothetical protein
MKGTRLCFVILAVLLFHKSIAQNYTLTEYYSLPVPQQYYGSISYMNGDKKIVTQDISTIPHDTSLLNSLPVVISAVSIYQSDKSGNLSFVGQSVSASNSDYVVIYEFLQAQQLTYTNDSPNITTSVLFGISVRMTAKLHTKKAGINIGNLFGIGLAASSDKLSGTLEVKAFGISSHEINEIIPVPTDLSTGTIQNALSAVATIKSHIYDKSTIIVPHILAFNYLNSQSFSANPAMPLSKVIQSNSSNKKM